MLKRAVVCATVLIVVASIGVAATATSPAAVSGVSVSVSCSSNPERLTIKNNRRSSITINKVGSTYQPRAGEPFSVYRALGPGKSVTFTFGTKRGSNKLTNQFIFADHPTEKAKVVTSVGTIKRAC